MGDTMSYFGLIRGFRSKDNTAQPLRLDRSTNTIQTIEYEHHEVHAGSHFFVVSYAVLENNHVLQFTWQMPNTTTWTHWTWRISTEIEILWQIYEGGTITNPLANAITPLNSNRNSSNTSGTTMRYEDHVNLADADTDVSIAAATLLKSGISGSGKDFGTAGRETELVLDQNALYVLRATAKAAGYINFEMEWYEHADIDAL